MAEQRAISGNQGFVRIGGSTPGEITEFSGTIDYGVKTYVAQSSVISGVGYQKTVRGNTKFSGTISGLFDPNYPVGTILAKGAIVALVMYEVYPLNWLSCNARVGTRTLGANINTGDPIPFSITVESDGIVNEVSI